LSWARFRLRLEAEDDAVSDVLAEPVSDSKGQGPDDSETKRDTGSWTSKLSPAHEWTRGKER
jgi:hypothetical protein